MLIPSLILDAAVAVLLIICIVLYTRRGFVAGVISFFGTFIALVAAALVAYNAAPILFRVFFRPGLEQKVADTIAQQGLESLEGLVSQVLGFLPESLIDSITENVQLPPGLSAAGIAETVVDKAIEPLLIPFIVALVFFVLFTLLRLLLGLAKSLARGISKLPAVGGVNRFLGGVMGLGVAFVYIFIAFSVIWAYDSLAPAQPLAGDYFARSITLRLAAPLNFFSAG
ncbi:CvpA family protein [Ruminococcaceae bacterium OttesenSCG-928-O06]|nr:CvpA family protein [Ruminococcaceae bacterium OttesenSCG-928-O06]